MKRFLNWCCLTFLRWLLGWIGGTYGETEEDARMKVHAQKERIKGREQDRIKVDASIQANVEMRAPKSFSELFDFGGEEGEEDDEPPINR